MTKPSLLPGLFWICLDCVLDFRPTAFVQNIPVGLIPTQLQYNYLCFIGSSQEIEDDQRSFTFKGRKGGANDG
jgi:hypothetical protein